MIKLIPVIVTTAALALSAAGAVAAKGGQADKKANEALPVPTQSQKAKENVNRNSGDDKLQGLDRARERMSEEGLEHSKSGDAQTKKQPKPKKNGK